MYILILLFGVGMTGKSVTTAEFTSKAKCEAAMNEVDGTMGIRAFCFKK